MTKNTVLNSVACKICSAVGLVTLGVGCSVPSVAADSSSQQCSLAIVTKQQKSSIRTCDVQQVRSLAKGGHVFEQNQLGMVSMLAMSPDYDPKQALDWFERAAHRGYAPAQVNLAVMYANGWGTPQNYGAALEWLHTAAKQSFPRAYYNLGILYLEGRGVAKDYAEALRWFQKGADAGDTGAQTNLAFMYDKGIGVERDLNRAANWYRKAADAGDAMAENDLADMYLRGEGLKQDDATAFKLFREAADKGHTGARIKLGYMYSSGRGTGKDPVQAYALILAASTAGDSRGNDLLHSLESQLSKDQIAQAKEQSQQLKTDEKNPLTANMFVQ